MKFADDGTIWKTGNHITELSESIEQDLVSVIEWAVKWRMNVNIDKT